MSKHHRQNERAYSGATKRSDAPTASAPSSAAHQPPQPARAVVQFPGPQRFEGTLGGAPVRMNYAGQDISIPGEQLEEALDKGYEFRRWAEEPRAETEPAAAPAPTVAPWPVVRYCGDGGPFTGELGGIQVRQHCPRGATLSIPPAALDEAKQKGFEFVRCAG